MGDVVERGTQQVSAPGLRAAVPVWNDELQVAVAYPAVSDVARRTSEQGGVAGIDLTENGPARKRLFARRRRHQIDPGHARRMRFQAQRVEDRGHDIDARGKRLMDGRLHVPVPPNENRGPQARIEGRAFRSPVYAKSRVLRMSRRGGRPTVVDDEHEQRVPSRRLAFKISKQLPHGLVEPRAGGVILDEVTRHLQIALVRVEEPLGRIVRLVREDRGVPDEEGRIARGGVTVDEVEQRLHRAPPDGQPGVAVAVGDGGAVGELLVPAARHARRPAGRHPVREPRVSVVPFPELSRLKAVVSVLGQDPRERR